MTMSVVICSNQPALHSTRKVNSCSARYNCRQNHYLQNNCNGSDDRNQHQMIVTVIQIRISFVSSCRASFSALSMRQLSFLGRKHLPS
jgi:hypothetical protein